MKFKMNCENLIEFVRQSEFLYNYNDKNYNDNQRKEEAWKSIGEKLNLTDKECKKQWNLLRDGFRRNLKQRKTATGQAALHIKKWKYEDEMSFIKPYLKDRPVISSIKATTSSKNISSSNGKQKIKTSEKITKYLVNDNRSHEEDEVDILFRSLAKTVKKFNPYNRAIAKAKVCSIVSDLELKNLAHQSSMVVAGSSIASETHPEFSPIQLVKQEVPIDTQIENINHLESTSEDYNYEDFSNEMKVEIQS